MFSLKNTILYQPHREQQLSEYITALKWSKDGYLAASSANGEVILGDSDLNEFKCLLSPADTEERAINCLSFSHNGQLLAVGGQDGKVRIWQIQPQISLIQVIDLGKQWIEHLAWHPFKNYLAFSLGRYVQIVEGKSGEIIDTLPFESSSVLNLAWRPQGHQLAVAVNGGIKVWNLENQQNDPIFLETMAAVTQIAWSLHGEYLAVTGLDNTVLVWRWGEENPWRMTGFGGKVRNLAWSALKSANAPLLAVSSYENIFVWQKEPTDEKGWISRNLSLHQGIVTDLAFHPHSLLLASVGEEGALLLWDKAKQLTQRLTSVAEGFSCLNWHPSGDKLAAGGKEGDVMIWQKSNRGKGFG